MPLVPIIPTTPEGRDPQPRLLPLRALLADFDRDAEALWSARQDQSAPGAITGFAKLDDALGGSLAPGVHVVLGAPGVGKTAWGLQAAAQCGCPALYITCEMTPLELLKRITARTTGIFLGRLKSGELPPAEAAARARDAIAKTPNLVLMDANGAYPDHTALTLGANATRTLMPDCPHLLIVMDSLHAWADLSQSGLPEYDRLALHLTALKRIARELSATVLLISERNRQSMLSGGLSGGAGHRGIEYGAETVLDLDIPPDTRPDDVGESVVLLRVRKNRHGGRGAEVEMRFHGGLQRYREV